MHSAGAGHTAGKDLSSLADEFTKLERILVIYDSDLVSAELADLLSLSSLEAVSVVFAALSSLGTLRALGTGLGRSLNHRLSCIRFFHDKKLLSYFRTAAGPHLYS